MLRKTSVKSGDDTPPKKKTSKSRKKTTYIQGRTASLAMPDGPFQSTCKDKKATSTSQALYAMYTQSYSLAYAAYDQLFGEKKVVAPDEKKIAKDEKRVVKSEKPRKPLLPSPAKAVAAPASNSSLLGGWQNALLNWKPNVSCRLPDVACVAPHLSGDAKTVVSLREQVQTTYDASMLRMVEILNDVITEHAFRRVELYFLLLVAVYDKQIEITRGTTVKQHGEGTRMLGSHACHSSFFPNIAMTPLEEDGECPPLEKTFFSETLNMTVELPKIVNEFDSDLEGGAHPSKPVRAALVLMNKVAAGKITPKQALDQFMMPLSDFFNEYKPKSKALATICQYQRSGSLEMANEDLKSVKDEYIYAWLRMTPDEIAAVKRDPANWQLCYKAMQDEIYGKPKVYRKPPPPLASDAKAVGYMDVIKGYASSFAVTTYAGASAAASSATQYISSFWSQPKPVAPVELGAPKPAALEKR